MDKVKNLTPGQRELAYIFNPELAERCPHFPSKPDSGLRPCKLTGSDCHFSTQMKYEECPIWIAYEKGKEVKNGNVR